MPVQQFAWSSLTSVSRVAALRRHAALRLAAVLPPGPAGPLPHPADGMPQLDICAFTSLYNAVHNCAYECYLSKFQPASSTPFTKTRCLLWQSSNPSHSYCPGFPMAGYPHIKSLG